MIVLFKHTHSIIIVFSDISFVACVTVPKTAGSLLCKNFASPLSTLHTNMESVVKHVSRTFSHSNNCRQNCTKVPASARLQKSDFIFSNISSNRSATMIARFFRFNLDNNSVESLQFTEKK